MSWRLALVALLCLGASAPPGWFPGAEFLVFPGWMAFYAAIDSPAVRRRKLQAYLIGTAHMLVFSFSVRHVLLPAYVGIGLVGGLYYVLAVLWTRATPRVVPPAVGFGLALAGVHWLRGHATEIQYPHGQPVHALYEFPALLGSLSWGSEVFGNLLLGVLAAGCVDLYRAWRVGTPGFKRSAWTLGAAVVVAGLSSWTHAAPRAGEAVRIAALEPGFGARDFFSGRAFATLPTRVVAPTQRLLAEQPDTDLVVWPESVSGFGLVGDPAGPQVVRRRGFELAWAGETRLLSGVELVASRTPGAARRVAALLTDGAATYLGHQEKRRLVPGGEHQPFLDWLPAGWSAGIREAFEEAMGQPLPDVTPGAVRPPLTTAAGVPFGTMTCFDNAFPHVTEEQVAAGARFLVVISNESWYLGGAELDQMVAMTVCRSLECRVPILRCTVDGATLAVSADGRVTGRLPRAAPGQSRFFCHDLALSAVGHPSIPPLHGWIRWLVLWSSLVLIGPLTGLWGRISHRGSDAEPPKS